MVMAKAEVRWKDGSAVTHGKDLSRALAQLGMAQDWEELEPEDGLWLVRITGREYDAIKMGPVTKGSMDYEMEVKAL